MSDVLKGKVVSGSPTLAPSTLNWTEVAFVEALAATVIVPDTVVPETGEVIDTVGGGGGTGFGLALLTLIETAALSVFCPVEVMALAVREWLPFESVVVLIA